MSRRFLLGNIHVPLINDQTYVNRVRLVAARVRENNQKILTTTRALAIAINKDVKIDAKIHRIADEYAVELEAAAAAHGEYGADARLLVWDDVDAVNNESME